jgi:hypothetical protein
MAVAETECKQTPDIAMLGIIAPGNYIMQTTDEHMKSEQPEQKDGRDAAFPDKRNLEDAVSAEQTIQDK